jgi:hypothetical protein
MSIFSHIFSYHRLVMYSSMMQWAEACQEPEGHAMGRVDQSVEALGSATALCKAVVILMKLDI